MNSTGRLICAGIGTAGVALGIFGFSGGGAHAGTPLDTLQTFLDASATGDAAKACSQLSRQAQGQVVSGASCKHGITAGATAYGAIIKQIKVANLQVHETSATATSVLNGRPTATFELRRQGGKWLIVSQHRVASAGYPTRSSGPSVSHVEAVAGCLDKANWTVDNGGLDSTGGTPHVVLTVSHNGAPAAEVDVFASALAALSGYNSITTLEGNGPTQLASSSVVLYHRALPAAARKQIEACG
jgi:limonene-1,2-epoxide hydrolase